MSNRDRRVLLRQRLGEVNAERRAFKQKEKTPEASDRMRHLNHRRIELVIEIVALDRKDRSSLVA
jgi:hypothetical protein